MTKKLYGEAHKIEREKLKTIHDHVLVYDMTFDGRQLGSGLVLLSDNGKGYGIRPRWGRVYAVGPDQTTVKVGQWVCIKHGRWTRGLEIEDSEGIKTLRRIDNDDILLISDRYVVDETISDGL